MYFPTTRVLTVLELLQTRQQMSGPELAARLEVDIRTVRRYITMLQDLGVPVEAERGRYGAYRLRPGFKLPPLMFTDDEALALTLGLLAARRMGLEAAAPATEGALAKLDRVLPAMLRERVRAVQETLIFDSMPAPALLTGSVLGVLARAAQQQQSVHLRYRSWNQNISDRIFDPYGLVYRSGCWYTAGYCHLRNDLRVFRLERVVEVEPHEEHFERPTDFDCLEQVVRAISQTPGHWQIDVLLLDISLKRVQMLLPPGLAWLEQEDEGIALGCYTDNLQWIATVLVGLRCRLRIRQPEELRTVMRQLAEEISMMADA